MAGSMLCGSALSLDVGFEGLVSYELRQNTDEINFANESIPDTEFATGLIGVFGEERNRSLNAGFSGEIDNIDDPPVIPASLPTPRAPPPLTGLGDIFNDPGDNILLPPK